MIKGVNRQIIEVSDTGNKYFERALLIVRANYSDLDNDMLHNEANQILKKAGIYTGLRINRHRHFVNSLLIASGGALFGALTGICLMILLH